MSLRPVLCLVLISALAAVGCGPSELDQQKDLNAQLAAERDAAMQERDSLLAQREEALRRYDAARAQMDSALTQHDGAIAERDARLAALQQQIDQMNRQPQSSATANTGEWVIQGGMAVRTIADNVLFDSGQAVLKPGANAVLDKVSREIRSQFPGKQVLVVGHTDAEKITRSKWKDNRELSYARAMAVTQRLTSAGGLPATRVLPAAAGEFMPKVPNGTNGRQPANRRVEIMVFAVGS